MKNRKNLIFLVVGLVVGIILVGLLYKKTYVISFDTDGGSLVANMRVKEGHIPMKPDYPSKEGYAFIAWQLDNKDYNFDKPVNSDINLVAKWIKTEYYIRIEKIDDYSPDRYLTVYKNEEPIEITKIEYLDGIALVCLIKDKKVIVANADIMDESSIKVTLKNGSQVIALLIK